MTTEEKHTRDRFHAYLRSTKRWLRWLPRRAHFHKYPVVGRFAEFAKQRAFLWSFRVENAVPAIYAGTILALLPLYGVQLLLGFLLALLLRANLPILLALQVITNPFTLWPVYFICFQIGRAVGGFVGWEVPHLDLHQLRRFMDAFREGQWGDNLHLLSTVIGATSLGGVVLGVFCAALGSMVYRFAAARSTVVFNQWRQLQQRLRRKGPAKPRISRERPRFLRSKR